MTKVVEAALFVLILTKLYEGSCVLWLRWLNIAVVIFIDVRILISKQSWAAAMAHTSRLLERSDPNDHLMEAKRPPFRTHHGTGLPPPAQALQTPPRRSAQPAQTGRNGQRLLRNGSIIADIIMSSSIALQACLGRCVWPPPLSGRRPWPTPAAASRAGRASSF